MKELETLRLEVKEAYEAAEACGLEIYPGMCTGAKWSLDTLFKQAKSIINGKIERLPWRPFPEVKPEPDDENIICVVELLDMDGETYRQVIPLGWSNPRFVGDCSIDYTSKVRFWLFLADLLETL